MPETRDEMRARWAAQVEDQEAVNAAWKSPGNPVLTRLHIEALAEERHAHYPQYDGHWSGPGWVLVKIGRKVRTKMGDAFEMADVTLAHPSEPMPGDDREFWTAYSIRNAIDTAVIADRIRPIGEAR